MRSRGQNDGGRHRIPSRRAPGAPCFQYVQSEQLQKTQKSTFQQIKYSLSPYLMVKTQ